MINGQTVLAVILARGGSKRVPGKNLREFRGKSLVSTAVEHAETSKYVDWVTVSTDDENIAVEANVPICGSLVYPRPPELSNDTASSEDAIRHVLNTPFHAGWNWHWVVLLQPTSPLRTAEDIDACIERAQMGDGCISINRSTGHQNGAVYVAKAEWIAKHDFTHQGLMKYPMDAERSLDIDTEEDFAR